MAARYTEKEVIERLQAEIKRGKPLFMPNCGCGLTAKLQEKGGSDLICISATSFWRMKGQGSLAPLMPYCDINEVILSLAPEIMANVKNVPVVSLSGATNPLLPHKKHLQKLWDAGISGINPFMMKIYGEAIMDQMENIGMGWTREVEMIRTAHEMNMFTLAFAFTPAEATILAEAGASAVSSHVGATKGGLMGAKTGLNLEEATQLSQQIFDAARKVNKSVILFAHGGPIEGPREVEHVFKHTNAQGFIGGSAAERVHIEKAVYAATLEYKQIPIK